MGLVDPKCIQNDIDNGTYTKDCPEAPLVASNIVWELIQKPVIAKKGLGEETKNLSDEQYSVKVSYNNVYVKICSNSIPEFEYECDYSVFKNVMTSWTTDYVNWCGIELPGTKSSDQDKALKTSRIMYIINGSLAILLIFLAVYTWRTKKRYDLLVKNY